MNFANQKVAVYLHPSEKYDRKSILQFRLTYEGEIPSGQSRPGEQIVDMRESFRGQLERLWERTHFLKHAFTTSPNDPARNVQVVLQGDRGAMHAGLGMAGDEATPLNEAIGNLNRLNGHRWVSLVSENLGLKCSLEILLLRSDGLISPVVSGDLDNRVKTIIDALKKPNNDNELSKYNGNSNSLFYVLLEDDNLIDGLIVEADELLCPNPNGNFKNARWAKVVITVNVSPHQTDGFNIQFL